jgi:hypothetical protein
MLQRRSRRKGWISEDFTRAERLSAIEPLYAQNSGICWFSYPDTPWSPAYYISASGQSNIHVYLWLLKDLAWTECWYWPGMVFGGLTLGWQLFMLSKSLFKLDMEDIWKNVALTLWLGGHFWWMSGELHDYRYPDRPSVYDERTHQTGEVFVVALLWVSAYYLLLKPFRAAGVCSSREPSSSPQTFQHRFPWYFHSWEEYENIHTLCWLAKDTAWNWWIPSMLLVFLVPTFLLAFDFVWVTLWSRGNLVDHSHYLSQLLWVCAASIWALGEFYFTPNHDNPHPLFTWSEEARLTARWYTAWCYILAFVPIVACHGIWIYGTMSGEIEYQLQRQRDERDRLTAVSAEELKERRFETIREEREGDEEMRGSSVDEGSALDGLSEHDTATAPLLREGEKGARR